MTVLSERPRDPQARPQGEAMAHKPAARSTVYHRFIPREEVQAATAWEFDSMGPGDDKPKGGTQAAPAPELPTVDLDALRQEAYAEGFAHGRQTGEQETREALDAPLRRTAADAAQRLATLLRNAELSLTESEDHLSEQLLALACDVARQVVRRELTTPLPAVRAVIDEALAATIHDELTRTLRLNPMDYALVQNHIDGLLDNDRIKLVADESITAGGCVLQTATGTVDGTLEKRWTRAVANLGLISRWEVADETPQPAEGGDG